MTPETHRSTSLLSHSHDLVPRLATYPLSASLLSTSDERRTPSMAQQRGREDGGREREMECYGSFDTAGLSLAGAKVGQCRGRGAC